MRIHVGTPLALLLLAVAGLVSCSDAGSTSTKANAGQETGKGEAKGPEKDGEGAKKDWPEQDTRGMFVRKPGDVRFQFVPWRGEKSANAVFKSLKFLGGGEVRFTPGRYTIEQRIYIKDIPDLTVSGMPGTVFEFANPDPEPILYTTRPIEAGTREIFVDRPQDMVVDWKYQLYNADGRGDRRLEILVKKILEDRVIVRDDVRYMPHIKEIPAGCQVLVDVNAIRVRTCPNLVIENIEIEGHSRGPVRGHTIYCGMYITGDYKDSRRPITNGMTIRGCKFRNLNGRGICYYGIGDVKIYNNSFHNIRAQAMEIDHFSQGEIVGNYVDGAEVGVTVNDAFDSLVHSNVIRNCRWGVKFMTIYHDDDWVNTTNTVADNLIGPGCNMGIFFRDPTTGNTITKNQFLGIAPKFQIVGAEGNTIELFEPKGGKKKKEEQEQQTDE
ncbi:MAG: right-handed parallel beta-helix repeat-containing protein [bacterium]|nr:right-handed parallel beta-helix repeat-containing protein [bacterium]